VGAVERFEIIRVEGGVSRTVQDTLVVDHELVLFLNGQPSATFSCTPADLEELVCGHLFAQGLISSKGDLHKLAISGSRADVVLRSGGGAVPRDKGWPLPGQKISFRAQELFQAMEWFGGQSALFAATGGVHSSALWHLNGQRIFLEDIGRHNAVDKVLGRALLAEWDLSQCALLTSGRVPGELIEKALNTGVQVIVSRSAPMTRAVERARKHGLTLCGFVRGERMNIYSGAERVLV
jgi:FdhD protein